MFKNHGKKIKDLADVLFILTTTISILVGIILLVASDDTRLIGFLLLVFVPIVSYISSLLMSGFGQMIENSEIIIAQNKVQQKLLYENTECKRQVYGKEHDGNLITATCPCCKAKLSYTREQFKDGKNLMCPACFARISF